MAGITLTSKTINSTYDSLLKLTDNDGLTASFKKITDGLGNDSGISINNSGNVQISGTLNVSGTTTIGSVLRGNATLTIDPAAHGDNTGLVVIAGDLQVDGTTTTINSTTVSLDDKNILLAADADNKAAANGAGITVETGTNDPVITDATILYNGTNDTWDFNRIVTASSFTGNLTGNVTGTVSSISNHDTDDLDEGTTNLYYTTARFNVNFNSKDTDDLDEGSSNLYFTDARARGAFSEGTGVTITNGQIAIGQSVGTTDDVTFNQVTADLVGNADTATTATNATNADNADTVDSKHATDFTLQYVTDNGNTTTNNITIGGTSSGVLASNKQGIIIEGIGGRNGAAQDGTERLPTLQFYDSVPNYGSGTATVGELRGGVEWYASETSGGFPAISGAIYSVNENTYNTAMGLGFYTNNSQSTPSEAMRLTAEGDLDLVGRDFKIGGTTVIDSNRVVYASSVRVTNIVTNRIVKFDGTDLDDSIMTDDGSTVSVAGDLSVDDKITITGTNNNLVIDEEADGTWHLYDTFQDNGIKIYSTTGGMEFQYNGVTEMTINGSGVVFTGTIDLSNANLNIGAADIVFGTVSTNANRGLIWDVDGSYLSKLVSGGTNGGMVEIFTNMGDGITGDVFRIKTGSTATIPFSIDNSGDSTFEGDVTINPSTNNALILGRIGGMPNIKSSDAYAFMDSNGGYAGLNWYTNDHVTLANGGGNVSIGNSSVPHKLTVWGNIGVNEYIYHNDDTNTFLRFLGDYVALVAGGRNVITMDEGTDPDKVNIGDSSTYTNNEGVLSVGHAAPSGGDYTSVVPKLHVRGADTSGSYTTVARFQAGTDANDTGVAVLFNHSNDRGLVIKAGRKDSDREVAYFDLVGSGGATNNMLTMGKYGNDYRAGINTTSPDTTFHVNGDAKIGGSFQGTNLTIEATDTAGAPATTAAIRMKGYEGRAIGTFFQDVSYSGQEWFAGLRYSGSFANYQIGYDASGSQSEYAANAMMTITNGSRVGIGTSAPYANLHIVKSAVTKYVDAYSTAVIEDAEARLQLCASNSGSNAAAITLSNESNHWAIHHRTTNVGNYLAIGYAATTSTTDIVGSCMTGIGLVVTTDGRVAIGGTTSPASGHALDVAGAATFDYNINVNAVDTGNPSAATDQIRVSGYGIIGNRSTFYVTNGGGDVQIGNGTIHNQNPAASFGSGGISLQRPTSVTGTLSSTSSFTAGGSIKAQSVGYIDVGANQTDSAWVKIGISSNTTEGFVMTTNSESGHIKQNTSIKMLTYNSSSTLIESGRFTTTGLGLGGQTSPSYPLDVTGRARITDDLFLGDYMYHNGDTNTSFRFLDDRIILYAGGVNMIDIIEGGTDYIDFANNTARITSGGAFETTGDIIAYTTTSLSDKNQKENIKKIESPIEKIKQINGYTFDWKHNKVSSGGVIAQEVEEILPEIVKEKSIMDSDPHKTVEYNGLIGLLIETVKEQQKQIDELKSLINK